MEDAINGPFLTTDKKKTRNPSPLWKVTEIKNDIITYHKFEDKGAALAFVESKR